MRSLVFVFGRWFDPPASKFNSATQTQWDIFDTKIFKGKSVPFLLAEPKLPLAGGGSCFSKKRRSWIMIFSLVVVLFSKYIYTGKRRVLNCIWILLTSIHFSNLAAINSFYIYFSLVFFKTCPWICFWIKKNLNYVFFLRFRPICFVGSFTTDWYGNRVPAENTNDSQ